MTKQEIKREFLFEHSVAQHKSKQKITTAVLKKADNDQEEYHDKIL